MLKKVSIATVPSEKDFEFNFEINGRTYLLTRKGATEKLALNNLYIDLLEIIADIQLEIAPKDEVEQPLEVVTSRKKKVIELKELPTTVSNVSNGIVFNTPKVVNNPGFQPKFREEIN